jgi:hypothetical protein
LRLNLLDAIEVGVDEFHGRDLLAAEFLESFGDRAIEVGGHG